MDNLKEVIADYVVDEALIVIPVLWIFGKIFKETPTFKDWLIPYVLTVIGTVITIMLIGLEPSSVVQGVLVSGAAIYGNQLYKQAIEGNDVV